MSSQQVEVANLSEVMSYDHEGLLQRLVEKEGITESETRLLYQDMLRFLYLCGTRDERLGPTLKLDVAWHHFILFTRDYADFCHRHFGKFIHHEPVAAKNLGQADKNEHSPVALAVHLARDTFGQLSDNWQFRNGWYCFLRHLVNA